jgi:E3 ubiquitin-protein ligase RNF115/126
MNGNNATFTPMATIQTIGSGGSERTREVLNLINMMFMGQDPPSLFQEDDIIDESLNDESGNNPVSREFMNSLDEIDVTEEMIQKGTECSICLDPFKIDEKCIQLPCKDTPHYFHCGSETSSEGCSGVKPWLQNKNTCPLCRTEFPMENESVPGTRVHAEPEPETPEHETPVSLIPTSNTDLSPSQIAGLSHTNIGNIVPDVTDNNIIEEQLINTLDNYLSRLGSEIIRNNTGVNEDEELQRAIELSLQDNNTNRE